MLRAHHRLYSTGRPAAAASSAAEHFLKTWQSRGPSKLQQRIDGSQLQRLCAALGRHAQLSSPTSGPTSGPAAAAAGTALPPGYHLVYFTPSQPERELGADGSDVGFRPPAPFTRRMWAGGEVEWPRAAGVGGGGLRVGQSVTETTRLVSAEGKRTRDGGEMVVVGVQKEFRAVGAKGEGGEGEPLVIDRRNWIYRPALGPANAPSPVPAPMPVDLPGGAHVRDLVQSPVALFRFSALTFNGHKIHYNREWCRRVEGHRNLVVHGPLNLILMLDFWRDVHGVGGRAVRKIRYRATSPLYAEEKYRITMGDEVDGVTEVKIVDLGGSVAMKATIESH